MIRRFVFFRFEERYRSDEHMAENLRRTHQVLREVPGVLDYEIGTPADSKAMAAWDMSISATFADQASVKAYIVHPVHRRYVDGFIKPRLEVLKAWNFCPDKLEPSGQEAL